MSARRVRLLLAIYFVLISIIVTTSSSSAQAESTVWLTPPDVTQFPHLTAFLDVHDSQGDFIHGLAPQAVTLQEDGTPVTITEIDELTPGVQLVIAVAPGESFSIRDGMGVSRYEYFLQSFLSTDWALQPAKLDDFSLLTLGGPQLIHTTDLGAIRSTLGSYTPETQDAQPSLEILASAMQVVADPLPNPGMERAILFITSPQETDVTLGLQSILANANQENIHIYVCMLAAPEVFASPGAAQMRDLAEQTRGVFWGFSHDEAVPDLPGLIEPLRYVYQLGYDSQVTTPGTHQLVAQVTSGSETLNSQAQTFELNLLPPTVSLLNTPLEIDRTYSSQPTQTDGGVNADLLPVEQLIRLKLDFPDGYPRPIVQTRLYVDGNAIAQNDSPPFDQLLWDLRPYTQDGTHIMLIEATDSLGMVGKSPEVQVRFSVPSTGQGMIVAISQKRPLILGAGLVVVSSVLVLALIIGGRIRPKPHPGQPNPSRSNGNGRRPSAAQHPVTIRGKPSKETPSVNGINPKPASITPVSWWRRLPWLQRKEEPVHARAYLMPLAGSDEPTLPASLQVVGDEVTLGSDSHQAGLVISDASIDRLHARVQYDGKTYVITDAGTVAGTWVNYEEVPPGGVAIHHMDIIHLGRIGFRFQLSEPGQLRKIIVTPLETRQ
jgi:hypothetical protein